MEKISVFWFRRDLRLQDNHGLYQALQGPHPVLPVFIFDPNILKELPKDDARVQCIHDRLSALNAELTSAGYGTIRIRYGSPEEVFQTLLNTWEIQGVYTNRDYEPYAQSRDTAIGLLLEEAGVGFYTYKDQVIFEQDEIVKDDGSPYVVYTPYMKKWKARFRADAPGMHFPSEQLLERIWKGPEDVPITLADMGFRPSPIRVPDYDLSQSLIAAYGERRNFPAQEGTSRLGAHLRFGTVSIRQAAQKAVQASDETFWQELIWREFFMQILWHFPNTLHEAFKKPYDRIRWRNNETEFEKWKSGQTGFPLVDAGMRELNATGYMHNRVRMLVASFLCKHLLIDWRWGEAYFAEKLLDYEMASNVGNWQWAAGSGVDAAPYFRIFNPMTQVEKFDASRAYIRKWVPEFDTDTYAPPMVDHKTARERCLDTYKAALDGATS